MKLGLGLSKEPKFNETVVLIRAIVTRMRLGGIIVWCPIAVQ